MRRETNIVARMMKKQPFFTRTQKMDFRQKLSISTGRLAFIGITSTPAANVNSRSLCNKAAEKSVWYDIASSIDSPGSKEKLLQLCTTKPSNPHSVPETRISLTLIGKSPALTANSFFVNGLWQPGVAS
uniref:Uncharacterized protein n=1 Tax=Opuntia streptacantha TaxID=393608 RepID=A0A7C9EAZ8_OPUST